MMLLYLSYTSAVVPVKKKKGITPIFVHSYGSHGLAEWSKHGISHVTAGIQSTLSR